MHEIQKKLLNLAQEMNLGQMTLREVGGLIGETSPQKIKHHLSQLEKRGLIRVDRIKGIVRKTEQEQVGGLLNKSKLLSIPIFGSANAGPAEIFADQDVSGFLRISSKLLEPEVMSHKLFAIKVQGPSMNRTDVKGKTIEDGDFIIVDSDDREPEDNAVVLSLIDSMANVKRLHLDTANQQIILASESTQDFPPIVIHEDDDYSINGRVVQVIKKFKV
ncbi:MAG: S24 family peptidase [Patescibacteria group bacterium]|nr:S24 family peptidase [Patescibacteria group bacterium]